MVRYIITLLKRLKYNLSHLFSKEKTIPDTSRLFNKIANNHTIDNFISEYFRDNVDSYDYGPKVFGIELWYPYDNIIILIPRNRAQEFFTILLINRLLIICDFRLNQEIIMSNL